MYGGVYHVANLKETANPHYILREFLVHSVDEVCVWEGGDIEGGREGENQQRGMARGVRVLSTAGRRRQTRLPVPLQGVAGSWRAS